ncbi:MAG: tetratricopeptide repeat protein [Acidimicrobiales bacterium]
MDDLSAVEWMHRGADHLDGDLELAGACYRRALELDPSLRGAWFDLGLVHKWRREWAQSLACNRRAAALGSPDPSEPDPAYWNAGIAATALADWTAARWAWQGYGIRLSDGDGPIEENFGPGVVRLPDGETVWGTRIDPARMVVRSVPLPDSGFRYADVVLHDGEPKGSRVADGREYSVFDLIARWRPSAVPTVEVAVEGSTEAVAQLVTTLEDAGVRAENWTETVTVHCKACSLGRVDYDHPDHQHPAATGSDGTARIGCSGDLTQITALVDGWSVTQHATVHGIAEVA